MPIQLADSYCRGMLQRPHPRRMPGGYVKQLLNLIPVGGALQSRPGIRPFQAARCAANIVPGGVGIHVGDDGLRHILVVAGTGVYKIPPYGDPITLPLTALPAAEQARSTPTRAWFLSLSGGAHLTFICDGLNTNLKYDGTQLTRMGIGAGPTPASPTTAAVGGDMADGTRKFVTTLVSTYHEGNPTPRSSARTVTFSGGTTTQQATFTSPVQGVDFDDPQVSRWKLWATEADGETYYLVDEADIGTSIVDTLSDDVLTAGTPLTELVNAEPPAAIVTAVEHRGQILAVMADDQDMLHHSNFDPGFEIPEGWPAAWQTPIAHGDGDQLTALASFHEYAIAWKQHSAWALVGNWPDINPQPIYVAGTRNSIGCPNQGAVRQLENAILFGSRDGAYALRRESGDAAGVVATRVSNAIDDVWHAADFRQWKGTTHDRKRRTLVFYGRGRA